MHDFATDAEALEVARAYLTPDASGQVVDVALVVYGDDERPVRSIWGDELAGLARRDQGATPNEAAPQHD